MRSSLPLQEPEQLASDDTRETAADLALALALGGASRHIPLGRLVVALAEHHDGVQRPVSQTLQEFPQMDPLRARMDALVNVTPPAKLQMLVRVGHPTARALAAPRPPNIVQP
jgi:hypothetical protein